MKRLRKLIKKIGLSRKEIILVSTAILISAAIGIFTLQYQVTFGYDQARDAFQALNIAGGDFKVIGPMTDIEGVFHGPIWYYFLALPYLFLQKDPQLVASFLYILSFLTIPLSGYLAFKVFKRKDVSIITMILYAFSPLLIAFSRWLSNPSFTLLVSPFILIFLWRYLVDRGWKNALMLGIFFGLMIQSNLAFVLLLFLLPIYLLVFRIIPRWKEVFFLITGLGISGSTYLLAEIKFGWRTLPSLYNYATESHTINEPFFERINVSILKLSELFSLGLFPAHPIIIGLITGVLIFLFFKRRRNIDIKGLLFVLLWTANIFIFLFFSTGISRSSFVFAPTLMVFILLTSYILVVSLPKKLLWVVVFVIVVLQAKTTILWFYQDVTPLSIQHGINAPVAKKVVEYTYKEAKDSPFIINTVTNPLFINTTWAYLYSYFGERMGYVPSWGGHDQSGYLGGDVLSPVLSDPNEKLLFFIFEPSEGIDDHWVKSERKIENERSVVVETKEIGRYIIEKRVLIE